MAIRGFLVIEFFKLKLTTKEVIYDGVSFTDDGLFGIGWRRRGE
jgi:hypothetical protein